MPMARHASPAPRTMPPRTTDRRVERGRGGRADSACVTGMRDSARDGHHAAAVAVVTARTRPDARSHNGRSNRSIRWLATDSNQGASATQPARPASVPTTAAVAPTATPLATIATRRCRSVAPTAASMPSCCRRRWAITTKPAAAIRHTSTMARLAMASTPTAAAPLSVCPRLTKLLTVARSKNESGRSPAGRNSTVTDWGGGADAGSTRTNSSPRSPGFSTTPTTVDRMSSRAKGAPTSRPRSPATASVTATSSSPTGYRPSRKASIGPPYGPLGSCARSSTVSTDPGIDASRRPISSTAPTSSSIVAMSAVMAS